MRQRRGAASWQTWAGTATARPARVVLPGSTAEVAAAVRDAARDGLTIRPVGSAHSFTACAVTDGGVSVDLRRMTGLRDVDGATGEVVVAAGTTLAALDGLLERRGLSMENLGDIDAQTIAGALSTGTHGSGAAYGGLATQVRGLELVLADGSVVTCSRTEHADLFDAARVGLGAFGVVTAVRLACVPSFCLDAVEGIEPFEPALAGLPGLLRSADHVDAYWFPDAGHVQVKRNSRTPPGSPPSPRSRRRAWWEDRFLANTMYGLLCRSARTLPALAPAVRAVSAGALPNRRVVDRAHHVLCTPRTVRFVESEWAVPLDRVGDLLGAVRDVLARVPTPVVFPVEVRSAAPDDAWLSTAYDRETGYVAVHQFVGMAFGRYFRAVQAEALALGGRPHWGKLHSLGVAELAGRYPRFADVLRVRDEVDPGRRFANRHLERVLGR